MDEVLDNKVAPFLRKACVSPRTMRPPLLCIHRFRHPSLAYHPCWAHLDDCSQWLFLPCRRGRDFTRGRRAHEVLRVYVSSLSRLLCRFEMVSDEPTEHLISWSTDGTQFTIHHLKDFAANLLPKHFKHSIFSSFVRQLNSYVRAPPLFFASPLAS